MELVRGLYNIRPKHRGCVLTIGNFDGVHQGHQAILRQVAHHAENSGLPAAVMTFEPQPLEFFMREEAPARLTRLREKLILLAKYGAQRVICLPFNSQTQEYDCEAFVKEILVDLLGVAHVVVGDDFRFGKNVEGDFSTLVNLGGQYGFTVEATHTLLVDNERVSSTRVRQALDGNRFAYAEKLLGHSYRISGRVIYGKQLGRQLDTPTANIRLHRYQAPLHGVYAVRVEGLDKTYNGVANVGYQPTLDGFKRPQLEVHIFDFSKDIYGRSIKIKFCEKIRDEKKFASLELLKAAIQSDKEVARQYFS